MKKPKRIVLGTGHPWYSSSANNGTLDSVCLTANPVAQSILLRGGERTVQLNYNGTGNWNKVRLVLEVLK